MTDPLDDLELLTELAACGLGVAGVPHDLPVVNRCHVLDADPSSSIPVDPGFAEYGFDFIRGNAHSWKFVQHCGQSGAQGRSIGDRKYLAAEKLLERLAASGSHCPESLTRVGWNVVDGDVDHPRILPVMARVGD